MTPQTTPVASTDPLRVIVADDHPLYRAGIVRALESDGDIVVVAEAANGREALHLIREHDPAVAVVDVRMPERDGLDVLGALAEEGRTVPVVLLSAFEDARVVAAALDAGAAAYVTKSADRDDIRRVVTDAAGRRRSAASFTIDPGLTSKELAVLGLARLGWEEPEIAALLDIDDVATSRLVKSALTKLGADSMVQAIELAVRMDALR